MSRKLEIACFSYEAAAIAIKAGANRLELCEDIFVGGVTPSGLTLEKIMLEVKDIPVFVMIHKMGNRYQYTKRELEWMIDKIGDLGSKYSQIEGYVFGAITDKNKLDIPKLKELIIAAEKKSCTFHRAFDLIENKPEALEQLIDLGFKRILTSGGRGNAIDNIKTLKELIIQAKGRIKILIGGGVRSSNIKKIIESVSENIDEIHSSAIIKGSNPDTEEIKKLLSAIEL